MIQFSALFLLISSHLLIYSGATTDTTLKQLFVIFRHGERAPTEPYRNDPHKDYEWPLGWGHLTNRGKLQMYTLGERIRQEYSAFIPPYYFPTNVTFFSSYADRCLMSAQLVGAGLFPPQDEQIWNEELLWQPVPVKYVERKDDNFIAMKQACKKYDDMYDELMKSDKVKKIFKDNEDLIKYLSDHSGQKMKTLYNIETLFNTLEIESLNNLTLPTWVKPEMLPVMKEIGAVNLALYSDNNYMKRMKGGVLIKIILDQMEQFINGKASPLHLFAGHDFTLVQTLKALGLIDTIKPKFGATLTFELHKDPEYKIKINYWDDYQAPPVVKILSGCTEKCDIFKFKSILEPVLPKNWNDECKV